MTIETKTKAASLATFIVATAGLSLLATYATDLTALPDWLEVPVGALVLSLTTLLTGYVTRHRPGSMSESARAAIGG